MKQLLLFFLAIPALIQSALAGSTSLTFNIGNMKFATSDSRIEYHWHGETIAESEVLAGGRYSPYPYLDEQGNIALGNLYFNNRLDQLQLMGRGGKNSFLIGRQLWVTADTKPDSFKVIEGETGRQCTIRFHDWKAMQASGSAFVLARDGIVNIVAADRAVGVLYQLYGNDGRINEYRFKLVKLDNCAQSNISLGNQDRFIELGWTKQGGWWLIGSSEQTLLRSLSGKKWVNVKLPSDISALVSAYAVSDRQIWLAAALGTDLRDDDPMLLKSEDGGRNWVTIRKGVSALDYVPQGWLEGQQRRAFVRD